MIMLVCAMQCDGIHTPLTHSSHSHSPHVGALKTKMHTCDGDSSSRDRAVDIVPQSVCGVQTAVCSYRLYGRLL